MSGTEEDFRPLGAMLGTEDVLGEVVGELSLRFSSAVPLHDMALHSQQKVALSSGRGFPEQDFSGHREEGACGLQQQAPSPGACSAGGPGAHFPLLPEFRSTENYHHNTSVSSGRDTFPVFSGAPDPWSRGPEGPPVGSKNPSSPGGAGDSFLPSAVGISHPVWTGLHPQLLGGGAGDLRAAETSVSIPSGSEACAPSPGSLFASDVAAFGGEPHYTHVSRVSGRGSSGPGLNERFQKEGVNDRGTTIPGLIHERNGRSLLDDESGIDPKLSLWYQQDGTTEIPGEAVESAGKGSGLSKFSGAADDWTLAGWRRGLGVSGNSASSFFENGPQRAAAKVGGGNDVYEADRMPGDVMFPADVRLSSGEADTGVSCGAPVGSQQQQYALPRIPRQSVLSFDSPSASRAALPSYNSNTSLSQLSAVLSLPTFPSLSVLQQAPSVRSQRVAQGGCPLSVENQNSATSPSSMSNSGSLTISAVASRQPLPGGPATSGVPQRLQCDAAASFLRTDELSSQSDLESFQGRTFVGNVPPNVTLDSIRHLADQYGDVIRVDYCPKQGQWAFAYILYKHGFSADRAAGALHGKRAFEVGVRHRLVSCRCPLDYPLTRLPLAKMDLPCLDVHTLPPSTKENIHGPPTSAASLRHAAGSQHNSRQLPGVPPPSGELIPAISTYMPEPLASSPLHTSSSLSVWTSQETPVGPPMSSTLSSGVSGGDYYVSSNFDIMMTNTGSEQPPQCVCQPESRTPCSICSSATTAGRRVGRGATMYSQPVSLDSLYHRIEMCPASLFFGLRVAPNGLLALDPILIHEQARKTTFTLLKDGPPGANLFIYGIPSWWRELELMDLVGRFGHVVGIRVPLVGAASSSPPRPPSDSVQVGSSNSNSILVTCCNYNRGYGFVSYDNVESALAAFHDLPTHPVQGKHLKIQFKNGDEQALRALAEGTIGGSVSTSSSISAAAANAAQLRLVSGALGEAGQMRLQQQQQQSFQLYNQQGGTPAPHFAPHLLTGTAAGASSAFTTTSSLSGVGLGPQSSANSGPPPPNYSSVLSDSLLKATSAALCALCKGNVGAKLRSEQFLLQKILSELSPAQRHGFLLKLISCSSIDNSPVSLYLSPAASANSLLSSLNWNEGYSVVDTPAGTTTTRRGAPGGPSGTGVFTAASDSLGALTCTPAHPYTLRDVMHDGSGPQSQTNSGHVREGENGISWVSDGTGPVSKPGPGSLSASPPCPSSVGLTPHAALQAFSGDPGNQVCRLQQSSRGEPGGPSGLSDSASAMLPRAPEFIELSSAREEPQRFRTNLATHEVQAVSNTRQQLRTHNVGHENVSRESAGVRLSGEDVGAAHGGVPPNRPESVGTTPGDILFQHSSVDPVRSAVKIRSTAVPSPTGKTGEGNNIAESYTDLGEQTLHPGARGSIRAGCAAPGSVFRHVVSFFASPASECVRKPDAGEAGRTDMRPSDDGWANGSREKLARAMLSEAGGCPVGTMDTAANSDGATGCRTSSISIIAASDFAGAPDDLRKTMNLCGDGSGRVLVSPLERGVRDGISEGESTQLGRRNVLTGEISGGEVSVNICKRLPMSEFPGTSRIPPPPPSPPVVRGRDKTHLRVSDKRSSVAGPVPSGGGLPSADGISRYPPPPPSPGAAKNPPAVTPSTDVPRHPDARQVMGSDVLQLQGCIERPCQVDVGACHSSQGGPVGTSPQQAPICRMSTNSSGGSVAGTLIAFGSHPNCGSNSNAISQRMSSVGALLLTQQSDLPGSVSLPGDTPTSNRGATQPQQPLGPLDHSSAIAGIRANSQSHAELSASPKNMVAGGPVRNRCSLDQQNGGAGLERQQSQTAAVTGGVLPSYSFGCSCPSAANNTAGMPPPPPPLKPGSLSTATAVSDSSGVAMQSGQGPLQQRHPGGPTHHARKGPGRNRNAGGGSAERQISVVSPPSALVSCAHEGSTWPSSSTQLGQASVAAASTAKATTPAPPVFKSSARTVKRASAHFSNQPDFTVEAGKTVGANRREVGHAPGFTTAKSVSHNSGPGSNHTASGTGGGRESIEGLQERAKGASCFFSSSGTVRGGNEETNTSVSPPLRSFLSVEEDGAEKGSGDVAARRAGSEGKGEMQSPEG
ncbi:rna recognition motif-containing protein, partial [Cystoisospora suis]